MSIEADVLALLEWKRLSETLPVPGGWTTWTPTITQTGDVTFTNTYCRYLTIGKLAHVAGVLTVTGSGSGSAIITVSGIPAAIAAVQATGVVGTGAIQNVGTAFYQGAMFLASTTSFQFLKHNDPTVAGSFFGANPAFNLAATDVLFFSGAWEIA